MASEVRGDASSPSTVQFLPAGDQAVVVEFGSVIDPEINALVHRTAAAIDASHIEGVLEMVPTYRSLLVYYDPLQVALPELQSEISGLALGDDEGTDEFRIVEIPTLYGGEHGPDLEFVAQNSGMTESEVIALHSGTDYLVYTMGFSPGFPYLGGLDAKLHTPRLSSPRTLIPAGSVGIAETQTGVYPVASPGGWRLIGRSPLKLFDPHASPPTVINAGDRVKFVPLDDAAAYESVDRQVKNGTYSTVTKVGR